MFFRMPIDLKCSSTFIFGTDALDKKTTVLPILLSQLKTLSVPIIFSRPFQTTPNISNRKIS